MPRAPRFTDRTIIAEAQPGRPLFVRDTPGLYLLTSTGKKRNQRWSFRYTNPDTHPRKVTTKSLGPYPEVTLEMAKTRAAHARKILKVDKLNPFGMEDVTEGRTTYGEMAREWFKSRTFRDNKQRRNVELLLFVYPNDLLNKHLIKIKPRDIYEALIPQWGNSPRQVRSAIKLIEKVIAVAKLDRKFFGDNPATWKNVQENFFPQCPTEEEHYAAMPWEEVPVFYRKLSQRPEHAAKMLLLCILTATRSQETRLMQLTEVDFVNRIWTIPKARTKKNRDHVVPLSPPAIVLLKQMTLGKLIGPKAMPRLLHRMGISQATIHGFRASFRNWTAVNGFDFEAAEMCLAHVVGNRTVRAYFRNDLLEKRREIMNAWAAYCCSLCG